MHYSVSSPFTILITNCKGVLISKYCFENFYHETINKSFCNDEDFILIM